MNSHAPVANVDNEYENIATSKYLVKSIMN